ncbi:MAG: hypothetical protein LBK41_04290 [Clostridiales bacterium]|jgi:hypothetical protein|nr:hypothetical protein [Clostridiales bacterium]
MNLSKLAAAAALTLTAAVFTGCAGAAGNAGGAWPYYQNSLDNRGGYYGYDYNGGSNSGINNGVTRRDYNGDYAAAPTFAYSDDDATAARPPMGYDDPNGVRTRAHSKDYPIKTGNPGNAATPSGRRPGAYHNSGTLGNGNYDRGSTTVTPNSGTYNGTDATTAPNGAYNGSGATVTPNSGTYNGTGATAAPSTGTNNGGAAPNGFGIDKNSLTPYGTTNYLPGNKNTLGNGITTYPGSVPGTAAPSALPGDLSGNSAPSTLPGSAPAAARPSTAPGTSPGASDIPGTTSDNAATPSALPGATTQPITTR